ncbi:hypothetical protein JB92DRAFT_1437108 [Gautieria morchelliformis]|nr:hypothetical protein JB92DRAFT_1437108 [Gautieria morchelliformis]
MMHWHTWTRPALNLTAESRAIPARHYLIVGVANAATWPARRMVVTTFGARHLFPDSLRRRGRVYTYANGREHGYADEFLFISLDVVFIPASSGVASPFRGGAFLRVSRGGKPYAVSRLHCLQWIFLSVPLECAKSPHVNFFLSRSRGGLSPSSFGFSLAAHPLLSFCAHVHVRLSFYGCRFRVFFMPLPMDVLPHFRCSLTASVLNVQVVVLNPLL